MALHPLTEDRQAAICAWLTANNINPSDIPQDADLTIRSQPDGTRFIHYEAYIRDTTTGGIIATERRDGPTIERRTAQLVVEPPAWWEPFEKPTREQLEAERDNAYRERAHLIALLAAFTGNAVIAPATDIDEPGWQIAYLNLGSRQASWHIAPRDADLFAGVERVTVDDPRAQWDGHTTDVKYEALRTLTAELLENGNASKPNM